MRPKSILLPLLAAGALLAGIALAEPVPIPNEVPATAGVVAPVSAKSTISSYRVFDARGKLKRVQRWRVSNAGGNCCEVYSHVDKTGRIFEFGGTYMHFSDDRGATWKRVLYAAPPETPATNGEGAVTVAPNGDIVGITWDPYSGDVLTSYKYTAATKKWETALTPLHMPFFDRPWISVVKGPVTVNGKTAPWATMVRGAWPAKDVLYMSLDGLHYNLLTTPDADGRIPGEASGKFVVPVVKDPMADWLQDVPDTGSTYLNAGGALHLSVDGDTVPACKVKHFSIANARWSCVETATPWRATTRQDSRGWLTRASVAGSGATVEQSTDGGRNWWTTTVESPVGGKFEGIYDVKVNGKLGRAVVLARFTGAGSKGQDVAFVLDVSKPQPRLLESMLIGAGDLVTAAGVTASGERFDFMTVGILPDGKIVATIDDRSGGGSPLLAIQL